MVIRRGIYASFWLPLSPIGPPQTKSIKSIENVKRTGADKWITMNQMKTLQGKYICQCLTANGQHDTWQGASPIAQSCHLILSVHICCTVMKLKLLCDAILMKFQCDFFNRHHNLKYYILQIYRLKSVCVCGGGGCYKTWLPGPFMNLTTAYLLQIFTGDSLFQMYVYAVLETFGHMCLCIYLRTMVLYWSPQIVCINVGFNTTVKF